MSDSYRCNGPPAIGQFSAASSSSTTCKNALSLGQPSAASSTSSGERKSDDIVGMVVGMEVGMEVHHYSPIEDTSPPPPLPATLTTLKAAVSPETPTVDGRAVSSEASMATVAKPPWQMINGVAMTPEWNKNKSVAKKKKPDEDSSSEDTCSSPRSATSEDFTGMLLWMRSENKAYAEITKRKAEECAEENKKRRSKEGYSPGFIITVDDDPPEEVKSERLSSDAAAATGAAIEQRE